MPSSKYKVSTTFIERHPRLIRQASLIATFAASFALGLAIATWSLVCRGGQCPSVDELEHYKPRQTSKLYSADGHFIAELGLERRTLLPLNEIPPMLRDAFLIVEDKRFYSHHGIDWLTIPGAIWADLRSMSFSQGFSTITMQLSGNIFPERINRRERSGFSAITRKLKEIKVARAIDSRM